MHYTYTVERHLLCGERPGSYRYLLGFMRDKRMFELFIIIWMVSLTLAVIHLYLGHNQQEDLRIDQDEIILDLSDKVDVYFEKLKTFNQ